MGIVSTIVPKSILSGEHVRPEQPYLKRIGLWAVCGVCALLGAFTTNGLITSVAFLVLPLLVLLLWRNGEPPVLLFGCMMQWLQATAAIFYTNHFGITLDHAFGSENLTVATWLSIAAVLVLGAGIRCAFIGAGESKRTHLESDADRMNINKIFALYSVSFAMAAILNAVAFRYTSITQPLLAIASLKWAVVFLLCYTVLHQRRGYTLLLACVGLEFVMGSFGVLSNFKNIFFVLVVAAMSSPLALRGRRLTASVVCFVVLFVLGIMWSAIKMDYRVFLAEETSDDVIPIERKFEKLADLVESVTWENFSDGLDAMILRVSYVNYFALALENVPARIPYENGELWIGTIKHVLTPRVLFPSKPILDDSERTRLYTGLQVAGMEQGTSIGIGYVGESYVDFGPVLMFLPIFLLGVLYGLIDRFSITKTRYKFLGTALGVSILIFNAFGIETSNIKLVGGVVTATLVGFVIYKIFGTSIMAYLCQWPTGNIRRRSSPPVCSTI